MTRSRTIVALFAGALAAVAAGCGSSSKPQSESPPASQPPKVALAAQAGGARSGADAAMFPVRPTTYVLDGQLPDLGAQAPVRRMVPHALTLDDVRHIGAALGLSAAPVRTPGGYEVRGSDATLTIATTGGAVQVSYFLGGPASSGASDGSTGVGTSSGSARSGVPATVPGDVTSPPPVPPVVTPVPPDTPATAPAPVDVPNAHDAETIARTLLDRIGVLDGGQWASDVSDAGGVAVTCAVGVPCPTVPPEVRARSVTFHLLIDGVRVQGVDWTVTLGSHARIESLDGAWASPELVGTYALRATTDVFDDLQHGRARYPGPQPLTATAPESNVGAPKVDEPTVGTPLTRPTLAVHVTGVSLGIAVWNAFDNGGGAIDLVPTYRFHANAEGQPAYDIEVLALAPSAVEFTNPAPTTVPQNKPGAVSPAPGGTPG